MPRSVSTARAVSSRKASICLASARRAAGWRATADTRARSWRPGPKAQRPSRVLAKRSGTRAGRHLGRREPGQEGGRAGPELPTSTRARQLGAQLGQRYVLGLVRQRRGAELLGEIADDLVLQRRPAAAELLDRLVAGHISRLLLERHGHDNDEDVDGGHRRVGDRGGLLRRLCRCWCRCRGRGRGRGRGRSRSGVSSSRGRSRRSRNGSRGRGRVDGPVVDSVGVLLVAEVFAPEARGGVASAVARPSRLLCHVEQRLGRADLDDALGCEVAQDDLLRLDPRAVRRQWFRGSVSWPYHCTGKQNW